MPRSPRKKEIGNRQALPGISLLLALIFLDQISKFWVVQNFVFSESRALIPGILHLTYHVNTGAAFGFFDNSTHFLIIASIVFVVLIVYYLMTKPVESIVRTSCIAILAGAIGNLIDRLRLGYVIDFIDLRVWPIFNIADSCITLGVVVILIHHFAAGRKA